MRPYLLRDIKKENVQPILEIYDCTMDQAVNAVGANEREARHALCWFYMKKGYTAKEVGKHLGITDKWVFEAKRRMKDIIAKYSDKNEDYRKIKNLVAF